MPHNFIDWQILRQWAGELSSEEEREPTTSVQINETSPIIEVQQQSFISTLEEESPLQVIIVDEEESPSLDWFMNGNTWSWDRSPPRTRPSDEDPDRTLTPSPTSSTEENELSKTK